MSANEQSAYVKACIELEVNRDDEAIRSAWDIAWSERHSSGVNDVVSFFSDLVDLVDVARITA